MKTLSKKQVLILVIVLAVALNVITFLVAYPQTFTPEFPYLSRDFSAYYLGEWRLFHNPTEIYYPGPLPGDYQILPHPQAFKYAPSFLVLFTPILALNYQNALDAFDLLQVALIPVLAFFVYKLIKDKNVVLGSIAAVIVLIAPLPSLQIETEGINGPLKLPLDQLHPSNPFAKLLCRLHRGKRSHSSNPFACWRLVLRIHKKTLAVSATVNVGLI